MIPTTATDPFGLVIEHIRIAENEFSDAKHSLYIYDRNFIALPIMCGVPETLGVPSSGSS
jgi:hypothetical protein